MGYFIAIISAFNSTGKDILSKMLAGRVSPAVSTCASFLYAVPFYLVLLCGAAATGLADLSISWPFFLLLVARSVTDLFAEGFKMQAFACGDISLVTSFLALSPLFLAILAPFVTNDPVTPSEVVALLCIVAGGVIVIQRDRATGKIFQLKAVLYALAAAFAFAMNSCLDRLAVQQGGALVAAFGMTVLAGLCTVPWVVRRERLWGGLTSHVRLFTARGACETIFMVTKLLAMGYLPPHIVVGVARISVVLSVCAGYFIFKERQMPRRLLGALVVYIGLIVLLWGHLLPL